MDSLHEYVCIFMAMCRWILLIMINVCTKIIKKIKTHILCSITFTRKSCLSWYNAEKYWRDEQATDDSTTRRMDFTCWVTKATDTHTHRISNTYCLSTAKTVNGNAPQFYVIVCIWPVFVLILSYFFDTLSSFASQVFFIQGSHFHKGCPSFIADRIHQPDTTSLFGALEPSLSHQPLGRSVTLNPVAK